MTKLSEENALVLSLVQAMIGAISPNFRRVSLALSGECVRLQFVLQADFPEDREEISDIEFEFEALQTTDVDVEVEVVVTDGPLHDVPYSGRLVFGRREP